jgi:hypothetical protein
MVGRAITCGLLVCAFIACALLGCSVDRTVRYTETGTFSIRPGPRTIYDILPVISNGGRVLAWVRVDADTGTTRLYKVIRAETREYTESIARADTLLTTRWRVYELDVSPDGHRLIAVTGDSLFLWTGRGEKTSIFPPDGYGQFSSIRWSDSLTFRLAASGPFGDGIYSYDLSTGRITPVITRYTRWNTSAVEADRAGARLCGESSPVNWTIVVEDRDGAVQFRATNAELPRFWRIVPDEPEGLLYLTATGDLTATRLRQGDAPFVIMKRVQEYGISHDGGWLISKVFLGQQGVRLVAAAVRDLR